PRLPAPGVARVRCGRRARAAGAFVGAASVSARVRVCHWQLAVSATWRSRLRLVLTGGAMYTLGINAAFHDPAACLVKDGVVLAAVEEERLNHVKHGKRPIPFSTYELPFNAIDYCLSEAGITLAQVDHVAYSFDPGLLLGRWKA